MTDVDVVADRTGLDPENDADYDVIMGQLTRFTPSANPPLLAARAILRRRLAAKLLAPDRWGITGDYNESQALWQADGIRRQLAAIGEAIGDGEDALDPLPALTQTPICGPTLRR